MRNHPPARRSPLRGHVFPLGSRGWRGCYASNRMLMAGALKKSRLAGEGVHPTTPVPPTPPVSRFPAAPRLYDSVYLLRECVCHYVTSPFPRSANTIWSTPITLTSPPLLPWRAAQNDCPPAHASIHLSTLLLRPPLLPIPYHCTQLHLSHPGVFGSLQVGLCPILCKTDITVAS